MEFQLLAMQDIDCPLFLRLTGFGGISASKGGTGGWELGGDMGEDVDRGD